MNLQPFTASIAQLPVQNGGVKVANLHLRMTNSYSPDHQGDMNKGKSTVNLQYLTAGIAHFSMQNGGEKTANVRVRLYRKAICN
jgi:hypothetical protein